MRLNGTTLVSCSFLQRLLKIFLYMHSPCLQELLRLPAVGPEMLSSFEQAFASKRSEKDQRNLIRKLLFNSGTSTVKRITEVYLHLPAQYSM